jgi:hypothetical protein
MAGVIATLETLNSGEVAAEAVRQKGGVLYLVQAAVVGQAEPLVREVCGVRMLLEEPLLPLATGTMAPQV